MQRDDQTWALVLVAAVCALLALPVLFGHPPAAAQSRPPTKLYSQGFTAETGGADVLATDLTIKREGALRIAVVCATAGTFSMFVNDEEVIFNKGNALAAGCGYTITWPVSPDDVVNFQTDTSGNVLLKVQASWSDDL